MLTAAVNTVAENEDWIKIFGIKLNLDRVAFTLPIGDGYAIYWYAVIIAFGLLLAMLYGFKKAPITPPYIASPPFRTAKISPKDESGFPSKIR